MIFRSRLRGGTPGFFSEEKVHVHRHNYSSCKTNGSDRIDKLGIKIFTGDLIGVIFNKRIRQIFFT